MIKENSGAASKKAKVMTLTQEERKLVNKKKSATARLHQAQIEVINIEKVGRV